MCQSLNFITLISFFLFRNRWTTNYEWIHRSIALICNFDIVFYILYDIRVFDLVLEINLQTKLFWQVFTILKGLLLVKARVENNVFIGKNIELCANLLNFITLIFFFLFRNRWTTNYEWIHRSIALISLYDVLLFH